MADTADPVAPAPRDALVIFARYPTPGQVKTRLGRVIGDDSAAALYRAFLADLAERFTPAAREDGYDLWWACAPGHGSLAEVVGARARIVGQRGTTLGDRLFCACEDLRAQGYQRVVIVGSDAPHLPVARVRESFARLTTHEVVLGPADDGGYYLIGLHLWPEPPDLFRGITMSTATVLAETLERAHARALAVAQLAPLFDVDEAEDLTRLATALTTGGPYQAPHTLHMLQRLGIA
jgi:rSAM/selenodomain-associated transferase 1